MHIIHPTTSTAEQLHGATTFFCEPLGLQPPTEEQCYELVKLMLEGLIGERLAWVTSTINIHNVIEHVFGWEGLSLIREGRHYHLHTPRAKRRPALIAVPLKYRHMLKGADDRLLQQEIQRLLELDQQEAEDRSIPLSEHYYCAVLDLFEVQTTQWLSHYIPHGDYHMWSSSRVFKDTLITKGEDYRIVEWELMKGKGVYGL